MTDAPADLRARLDALLHSNLDRASLRRELEALAAQPGFGGLAAGWAPALLARDPQFFQTFLLKHLDGRRDAVVIRVLLPQLEAAGHDQLFSGLYRKLINASDWRRREADWNADILALAQSAQPDETVRRALERREMRATGLRFDEPTALALYTRAPDVFRDFVRAHLGRGWGRERRHYHKLRAAAALQGDDDFVWELFRVFAEPAEWTAALRRLLDQPLPPEQVVAELRRRHPVAAWEMDPGILVDFLERYGRAVLPYIEDNLFWIRRRVAHRLLRAVSRLGDEALYWSIFFRAGQPQEWNQALRQLLSRDLPAGPFWAEVQRRMPPPARWHAWWFEPDVALALYRLDPARARPFLEQCVQKPDPALIAAAQARQDEELLDFLSFQALQHAAFLLYRAVPPRVIPRWGWKPDPQAQAELEQLGQVVCARFDRLHAQSPETYVRHAANLLGRFRAFGVWSFARNREHNPIFRFLLDQHRAAWCRSPEAIRELLESPNIYVQIMGLEILEAGGTDAALRVLENLPLFRALLIGRARRNTKKLALACLEQAARAGPEAAGAVLPLLEEAMDFHGRDTIDERLLVSYVRLRRRLAWT
jgi:hypothetical protein